jgi:lysophospholipase L1-like esterase
MRLTTLLLAIPLLLGAGTRKPENVLVIGDSQAGSVYFTTQGAKLKGETSAQTMARLAGATYNNESVAFEYKGGTPVDYWSKQGHGKDAIVTHPDAGTIIIFLGTNDYWKTETPDVEPLLKEIRSNGLKCVWAGNTAVNGRKWSINARLKAAVEKDCTYIDSESIPLGDKVHPTAAGAVEWIKKVWSAK